MAETDSTATISPYHSIDYDYTGPTSEEFKWLISRATESNVLKIPEVNSIMSHQGPKEGPYYVRGISFEAMQPVDPDVDPTGYIHTNTLGWDNGKLSTDHPETGDEEGNSIIAFPFMVERVGTRPNIEVSVESFNMLRVNAVGSRNENGSFFQTYRLYDTVGQDQSFILDNLVGQRVAMSLRETGEFSFSSNFLKDGYDCTKKVYEKYGVISSVDGYNIDIRLEEDPNTWGIPGFQPLLDQCQHLSFGGMEVSVMPIYFAKKVQVGTEYELPEAAGPELATLGISSWTYYPSKIKSDPSNTDMVTWSEVKTPEIKINFPEQGYVFAGIIFAKQKKGYSTFSTGFRIKPKM